MSPSTSRTRVEDRHQWFNLRNKLAKFDIWATSLPNTKENETKDNRRFVNENQLLQQTW